MSLPVEVEIALNVIELMISDFEGEEIPVRKWRMKLILNYIDNDSTLQPPVELIVVLRGLKRMIKYHPGEEIPVRKWQLKLILKFLN